MGICRSCANKEYANSVFKTKRFIVFIWALNYDGILIDVKCKENKLNIFYS
jgi:hypothetical protein